MHHAKHARLAAALAVGLLAALFTRFGHAAEPARLKVFFLGDNGHHQPAERAAVLAPYLAKQGIDVTYSDKLDDLNRSTLDRYDAVLIYANWAAISPEQEAALVSYVEDGHGFVPVHCASACFTKSAKYVALVGGQFKSHGTGVFRPHVIAPEHPIMRGFHEFETFDESYEHRLLTGDREVLMVREAGDVQEPWTWVRKQGRGRVFYTASGHDDRCWRNPGFLNLLERGIRWSVGGDPQQAGTVEDPLAFDAPEMTTVAKDAKPFEYAEAKIAFYPPGEKRKGDSSWNKMQRPLSAEESMKHITVPQGFSVELFAAEPEIKKPICMNWDERGRLWIAETVDYPNELQPPGAGRDTLKICEDTDGDGRADKFTVFADKLSIPTSLTFARGGVIVHQAPDTLFLRDTDGDDKADQRTVLFTGWSTRDTHAGPSNLQYGLDNWIWGMQGYAGFEGTVGGEKLSFRQGFYRFKPDGSKLEFIRSTNNNTWGLGFSEEGLVFGSTANRNPSVYMPIANRYYEAVRGWSAGVLGTIADTHLFHAPTEKIRQVDHHGGYTAGAGHALYTARRYPKEYWNRTAFVAEPTGHLVGTFLLTRDGSDFHSTNPFNLLASDDEWVAPIMAEVGPDGNVWVIDWYNYIVQHNPTPAGFTTGKGSAYETDLRDKRHGRIYRVVFRNAPAHKPLNLHGATSELLVQTLSNPNMFWRKHAQRLLVERGKVDVEPALMALAQDYSEDSIELNVGAIHALWTMRGLDMIDESNLAVSAAVAMALKHPSAGVRRNAVAVLPATTDSVRTLVDGERLNDLDAQVQLAALLALADIPADASAGEAIARMICNPENYNDRWIPDAATSAAAKHDVYFLRAIAMTEPAPPVRVLALTTIVSEHYARGRPTETVGALLTALHRGSPEVADAVIAGLNQGWQRDVRATLSADDESSLARLLKKLPPGSQGRLLSLAGKFGSASLEHYAAEIAVTLMKSVEDDKQPVAMRVAAARQLVEFRRSDPKVVEQLLAIVSPRSPSDLAAGLIEAVGASRTREAGRALVERLTGFTPPVRAAAIGTLLGRADWTTALLDAVDKGQAQFTDLTLDQKQALALHPNKELRRRAKQLLERGGALPNTDRQKVLTELMPLTQTTGSVASGKLVFTKTCAKCHTHSGEGSKVGPDLTGMAVHPKAELLTHILDPSRSVEGNFRAYTVVTEDGRVLNGLLASESKTSIELVDNEGKRHAVQRADVEDLLASNKSIMPEGFEKQLKPQELVDLLEFLTTRGRFLPLPLAKAATVVTTKSMFHSGENGPDRLVFDEWGQKTAFGVPFQLLDPRGTTLPNAILLYGPGGTMPPKMPRSVKVVCNSKAKLIHLLSGVSGWGYPASPKNTVSMIVRLYYDDGQVEDHPLVNGQEFADYIRRVDVPGSKLAFMLGNQQLRYLSVAPKRTETIREIEFVKGADNSAPIVMAVTVESP